MKATLGAILIGLMALVLVTYGYGEMPAPPSPTPPSLPSPPAADSSSQDTGEAPADQDASSKDPGETPAPPSSAPPSPPPPPAADSSSQDTDGTGWGRDTSSPTGSGNTPAPPSPTPPSPPPPPDDQDADTGVPPQEQADLEKARGLISVARTDSERIQKALDDAAKLDEEARSIINEVALLALLKGPGYQLLLGLPKVAGQVRAHIISLDGSDDKWTAANQEMKAAAKQAADVKFKAADYVKFTTATADEVTAYKREIESRISQADAALEDAATKGRTLDDAYYKLMDALKRFKSFGPTSAAGGVVDVRDDISKTKNRVTDYLAEAKAKAEAAARAREPVAGWLATANEKIAGAKKILEPYKDSTAAQEQTVEATQLEWGFKSVSVPAALNVDGLVAAEPVINLFRGTLSSLEKEINFNVADLVQTAGKVLEDYNAAKPKDFVSMSNEGQEDLNMARRLKDLIKGAATASVPRGSRDLQLLDQTGGPDAEEPTDREKPEPSKPEKPPVPPPVAGIGADNAEEPDDRRKPSKPAQPPVEPPAPPQVPGSGAATQTPPQSVGAQKPDATQPPTTTVGNTVGKVQVRSVKGLKGAEARMILLSDQLGKVSFVSSPKPPPSKEEEYTVVSQNPPKSTDDVATWVAVGTPVTLVVYGPYGGAPSTQNKKVFVRSVKGLKPTEARTILNSDQLGKVSFVSAKKRPPSKEEEYTVVSQTPPKSTDDVATWVAVGTPVTLTVYGPYNGVPNVRGMLKEEAVALLKDYGLDGQPVGVEGTKEKVLDNRVKEQAPQPSTEPPTKKVVSMWIYAYTPDTPASTNKELLGRWEGTVVQNDGTQKKVSSTIAHNEAGMWSITANLEKDADGNIRYLGIFSIATLNLGTGPRVENKTEGYSSSTSVEGGKITVDTSLTLGEQRSDEHVVLAVSGPGTITYVLEKTTTYKNGRTRTEKETGILKRVGN